MNISSNSVIIKIKITKMETSVKYGKKLVLNILFISIIIPISIFAVTPPPGSPVAINGSLAVKGVNLVNSHGNTTTLKGVSYGWHNWWPRFYNDSTVSTLANEWGASILRAAIGVDPYNAAIQNPNRAVEFASKIIDAAIEQGIYVLVDWHSHKIHTDEASDFFTKIATKYKGIPNVIYEIFNEPEEDSWEDVKKYSEQIIKVIRNIEPNAIIIVGNPHWDQDIHVVADNPITGYTNLMYTVHFYADTHRKSLRDRADYARLKGIPIFVSECAAMNHKGKGKINMKEWNLWREWMDKNNVSWIAWSISDQNETCSMLLPSASSAGSWNDSNLSTWGKIIKSELLK